MRENRVKASDRARDREVESVLQVKERKKRRENEKGGKKRRREEEERAVFNSINRYKGEHTVLKNLA